MFVADQRISISASSDCAGIFTTVLLPAATTVPEAREFEPPPFTVYVTV